MTTRLLMDHHVHRGDHFICEAANSGKLSDTVLFLPL